MAINPPRLKSFFLFLVLFNETLLFNSTENILLSNVANVLLFSSLVLSVLFAKTVKHTEARVTDLPQAAQVNLSVTALAGNATAETLTIVSYTGN